MMGCAKKLWFIFMLNKESTIKETTVYMTTAKNQYAMMCSNWTPSKGFQCFKLAVKSKVSPLNKFKYGLLMIFFNTINHLKDLFD